MSLHKIPALWVILGLSFIVGACASPNHTKSKGVVMEPPKALPLPLSPPPQEGSLWTPRSPRGLLADLRACNMGDIVTVVITENSAAGDAGLHPGGQDFRRQSGRHLSSRSQYAPNERV